jgi:hypothetical protein
MSAAFSGPMRTVYARRLLSSGQSRIAKWLIDNDRGEFVRDRNGYERVLSRSFANVDLTIREDYSHVPYTFIIGVARN